MRHPSYVDIGLNHVLKDKEIKEFQMLMLFLYELFWYQWLNLSVRTAYFYQTQIAIRL